jgi:hypothetical protein
MLERLSGTKKTPLNYKHLPCPKPSARAALAPMQRHVPWSIATVRHCAPQALSCYHSNAALLSVLLQTIQT